MRAKQRHIRLKFLFKYIILNPIIMRHIILIVLLALYAPAFAQPVLTAANSSPQPGDVLINQLCDTTGITEGSAGAGVTWDYTDLHKLTYVDTYFYSNCDTYFNRYFPDANLLRTYYDRSFGVWPLIFWRVLRSTSDSLTEIGVTTSVNGVPFNVSPARKWRNYPSMYSSGYSRFYFGLSTTIEIFTNTTYDAYGTLKLPGAIHSNVLRQHYWATEVDTLDTFRWPVQRKITVTDSFAWLTPGLHNPVFSITYISTTNLGYSIIGTEKRVVLSKQYSTLGISENRGLNRNAILYPNPASKLTTLSITVPVAGMVSIEIYDAEGRYLKQLTPEYYTPGKHNIPIATSDLPPGLYFVHVRVSGEVQVVKLVVE